MIPQLSSTDIAELAEDLDKYKKRIAALESMIFVVHDALGLPNLDHNQLKDSDGMRSILSVYTSAINKLKTNSKDNPTESQQDKIKVLEGRLVTSEKRIASLLEERRELRGRVADADTLIGRLSRILITEGVLDLPE